MSKDEAPEEVVEVEAAEGEQIDPVLRQYSEDNWRSADQVNADHVVLHNTLPAND